MPRKRPPPPAGREPDVLALDTPLFPPDAEGPVALDCPLRLPLGPTPTGYLSRHVEAQLSAMQALTLVRLRVGLESQNARLADGKRINSGADVIRHLLEQIAAANLLPRAA